jgi:cyclohexanone monooxygenase
VTWMMETLRERGAGIVDIKQEPEDAYAEHCKVVDIATRPLRDCVSYYNGEGNANPGSLAYYGGPTKWHELRTAAQETMDVYMFEPAPEGEVAAE